MTLSLSSVQSIPDKAFITFSPVLFWGEERVGGGGVASPSLTTTQFFTSSVENGQHQISHVLFSTFRYRRDPGPASCSTECLF